MDVKYTFQGFEFSFFVDTTTGNAQQSVGEHIANMQIVLATFAQHHIVPDAKAQPQPANATQPNNGMTEEVWVSSKVKHGFFNNKHTFNICGGRWEQFGVPVYNDIAEIAQPDKDMIFNSQLGEMPFVRKVTVLIGADGKPKKVKKVETA